MQRHCIARDTHTVQKARSHAFPTSRGSHLANCRREWNSVGCSAQLHFSRAPSLSGRKYLCQYLLAAAQQSTASTDLLHCETPVAPQTITNVFWPTKKVCDLVVLVRDAAPSQLMNLPHYDVSSYSDQAMWKQAETPDWAPQCRRHLYRVDQQHNDQRTGLV